MAFVEVLLFSRCWRRVSCEARRRVAMAVMSFWAWSHASRKLWRAAAWVASFEGDESAWMSAVSS